MNSPFGRYLLYFFGLLTATAIAVVLAIILEGYGWLGSSGAGVSAFTTTLVLVAGMALREWLGIGTPKADETRQEPPQH